MAPHLQRGGCAGLCARRAGCRRRRAGAAQRPSPVGSTHRPFTARVADALVERLTGEMPTAQATAPADELPRSKLQAALAALPENDRGNTLLLAAREGLTPKETTTAEHQSRRPARGLSRFVRVSAPRRSWSWRRLPGHRSARQARHTPPRRTGSGRGRKPARQVLKETKWCAALISTGSSPSERACSLPQHS
jgi:hypothetical protein